MNGATRENFFNTNTSLMSMPMAKMLLKDESNRYQKDITAYLKKFPSNFKAKIKSIFVNCRLSISWMTHNMIENLRRAVKHR